MLSLWQRGCEKKKKSWFCLLILKPFTKLLVSLACFWFIFVCLFGDRFRREKPFPARFLSDRQCPSAQGGLGWWLLCALGQLRGMLHCALGLASMTSAVLFSYTCKVKHLCKCLENQVLVFLGTFYPHGSRESRSSEWWLVLLPLFQGTARLLGWGFGCIVV